MNRGFGGASIKDIQYYYNDVIGKYHPSSVVIYDDIDIEMVNLLNLYSMSIFRYWVGFIEISQNAGFCLFL